MFAQPALERPLVIRGAGDAAEPGLSLLVDHGREAASTVDLRVDIAIVSGGHPDGAGLVFHWTGAAYNIIRYSPSEGGWHAFTVLGDNRTKLNATRHVDAPPGPGFCDWTNVHVEVAGAQVQVFQDEVPVLSATLPQEASQGGQAGLFLRGGTVAFFAGYSAASG